MKKLWKLAAAGLLVATGVYAAEVNDLNITDASNTARFPEGMAPSQVNNAARALEGILARWFKDQNGSLDTGGSADTYTLAANQTLSAYYEGLKLTFEVTATNTGPSTLNVDSLGAKTIMKYGGVELEANDIGAGEMVTVVYDGTNFQLVTPVSPLASTATSGNIPLFSGTAGKFTDSGYAVTEISALNAAGITSVKDEDNMASDSATALATQQSIKAYVDTNSGKVGQVVSAVTGAVSTGTNVIPLDDTIPQNTEGDEYMTLAITPANASSTLVIEVVAVLSHSAAGFNMIGALFQDSTANALAAVVETKNSGDHTTVMKFTYVMTSGTTSATTFKFRAGSSTSGTTTFNGFGSARKFGGVMASSMTITEVLP